MLRKVERLATHFIMPAKNGTGEPDPEPAPHIERRIGVPLRQWLGMAVVFCLPVLGLAGVFGNRFTDVQAASATLELRVHHPTCLRFHDTESITVLVRNRSDRTLERIAVSVDPAFLEGFSHVHMIPPPSRAYAVELPQVAPGETRRVSIELQGEHYGRLAGTLRAESAAEHLELPIHSFVFP